MIRLGVVGYGSRCSEMVHQMMKEDSEVILTAIADPAVETVKRRLQEDSMVYGDEVKIFTAVEDMLADCSIDAVVIGTRCSLHAQLAMKVLSAGLPLFLEKPVATNYSDLITLKHAYDHSSSPVVVSFPLRVSPIVQFVKELIDSGKIGTVEHVQAVNNVPYGTVYFQSWYRDESETGGLFLQKATHDFDYINFLVNQDPVKICAMKSKRVFVGNHPPGLKCVDCSERYTCQESTLVKLRRSEESQGEYCAFAVDTGNEDSSSVIIQYANGMHAAYSQNVFIKKHAQRRGARLMGYDGTIEFDFYTNKVRVMMHHSGRVEDYQLETNADLEHSGGDQALAHNFVQVILRQSTSSTPLDAGLLSALMCLKARDAANTLTYQDITWSQPITI